MVAPLLALLSHRGLYRTHSPENGKTGHHASVLASVAGRTTGSASSFIGCHVLQWDGLLGLYPYTGRFLCHRDNYSNAEITVHPLDWRVFGLFTQVRGRGILRTSS